MVEHSGWHPENLENLVTDRTFEQINMPLQELRKDKRYLILNVCNVGRHRSPANAHLQQREVIEFFWNPQRPDDHNVASIALSFHDHWNHLRGGKSPYDCEVCGCKTPQLRSHKKHESICADDGMTTSRTTADERL